MPALADCVRTVIAKRRVDPRQLERQRLSAYLESLPPERRVGLYPVIACINGKLTACLEARIVDRIHWVELSPRLVAHWGRWISDEWDAFCSGSLTKEQAAAVRDALGPLPRGWTWPNRWYAGGRMFIRKTGKTWVVRRPLDAVQKGKRRAQR